MSAAENPLSIDPDVFAEHLESTKRLHQITGREKNTYVGLPARTCDICNADKPLHEDFWHKNSSAEPPFRTECKVCRNKNRRLTEMTRGEKRIHDKLSKVVEGGVEGLTEMLKHGGKAGSRVPHMAEIYQHMMEAWGGPRGFAGQVLAEYFNAKPGSASRVKIIGFTQALSIKVSESGAAKKSYDMMTDEELEEIAQEQIIEQVQAQVLRLVHDGEHKEDTPEEKAG